MKKNYLTLFLFTGLFLFASCQNNMQDQKAEEYKAVFVEVNKILDGGNIDELGRYIADDVIDHQMDPTMSDKPGLEGVKEMFMQYHKVFPDMKTIIHSMAVTGDTLFAYVTSTGTSTEPFMGMPANQKMTYKAVDILRFENGKAVEHWGFVDPQEMMNMMQQPMMEEETENMESNE